MSDAISFAPAVLQTAERLVREQAAALPTVAPRTILNGPITGSDDTTYFFYDAVHRKVGEIGPKFDANGGVSPRLVSHTTYGADGQVEVVELGSTTSSPSWSA